MNSTPEQLRFASIPAHSVRADFAGGGLSSDLAAASTAESNSVCPIQVLRGFVPSFVHAIWHGQTLRPGPSRISLAISHPTSAGSTKLIRSDPILPIATNRRLIDVPDPRTTPIRSVSSLGRECHGSCDKWPCRHGQVANSGTGLVGRGSSSGYAAERMIAAKDSGSRLAPPTSAPSTSGCAISSAAFVGVTLPPYRMRTVAPSTTLPASARTWAQAS